MHAATTETFHVTRRFVFTEAGGRVTVAKFGLQKKVDGQVVKVPFVLGDFSAATGRDFEHEGGRLDDCDVSAMQLAVYDWRRLPR